VYTVNFLALLQIFFATLADDFLHTCTALKSLFVIIIGTEQKIGHKTMFVNFRIAKKT
jgi:hypothetical protein